MLKAKPSIEEEMDFETEEPITLIVDDASGLTVSSKKCDYILRRNGYVRKRSLSSCCI